uniref:Secreted protein n=1 Tax=Ascaris lumbricoides TaxID=6252 RepID=A0A0M3HN88_ASCLU
MFVCSSAPHTESKRLGPVLDAAGWLLALLRLAHRLNNGGSAPRRTLNRLACHPSVTIHPPPPLSDTRRFFTVIQLRSLRTRPARIRFWDGERYIVASGFMFTEKHLCGASQKLSM